MSAEEQNILPGGQACKSAAPLKEVDGVSSGVDYGQIESASVSAVLESGLRKELRLNVKSCRSHLGVVRAWKRRRHGWFDVLAVVWRKFMFTVYRAYSNILYLYLLGGFLAR